MTDDRPTWLTPGFAIQIITIIVSVAIGWATMNAKIQGVQERLVEVRAALPNGEALAYRLKTMEDRLGRLEGDVIALDTWQRNTRERLAEKGWKP